MHLVCKNMEDRIDFQGRLYERSSSGWTGSFLCRWVALMALASETWIAQFEGSSDCASRWFICAFWQQEVA